MFTIRRLPGPHARLDFGQNAAYSLRFSVRTLQMLAQLMSLWGKSQLEA